MGRLHIALPVLGLLLSGGVAFAATGSTATSPGTAPASTTHSTAAHHSRSGASSASGTNGKFATQAEADKACGSAGNVVWGNTGTKVYHLQGDKFFGHTKHGAFMCKSTATAEGFHQSGQAAHKG